MKMQLTINYKKTLQSIANSEFPLVIGTLSDEDILDYR